MCRFRCAAGRGGRTHFLFVKGFPCMSEALCAKNELDFSEGHTLLDLGPS